VPLGLERIAHVWFPPAASAVADGVAGTAHPTCVGTGLLTLALLPSWLLLFRPQHQTEPVPTTAQE